MQVKKLSQWFCTFGLTLLFASSAQAGLVEWEATMGLLPNQVDPSWTLTDSAEPEDPVLASTHVALSTSENSELMTYTQSGAGISIPDTLTIEVRMRLVSGSSSSPARAPANVSFALSQGYGSALSIDVDEIFLHTGNSTKGLSAFVDTDGDFHTYVIETDGFGNISVSHDGVPTLTGAAFNSASFNGPEPRVSWGMGSSLSNGVSEWEYVRHNAGLERVPALGPWSLVLLVGVLGSCGLVLSRATHRSNRAC